jgi:glycosyltransferase involved in cell wall biosynthesis
MRKSVRITIVTPSFNQAAYIGETIESVLSQGYANLEYWIVDGGSIDGSQEVIRQYERYLAGWISEKDGGQADALNKGFRRATGEVFGFINSDDLLEPGSLGEVARQFTRAECNWIASPVRCFGESLRESMYPAAIEHDITDWLCQCPIPQQGTFWSAALWKRWGEFRKDFRYVFDYEYWLRLRFRAGITPRILDRPLGAFRFHAASKTVSERGKFEGEERRVRREYRRGLPTVTKARAVIRERQSLANWRQLVALDQIADGRTIPALSNLTSSIAYWPPLLLSRRTAGVVRRLLSQTPR